MSDYPICECGEFRASALGKMRRGAPAICLNCAAPPGYPEGVCTACNQTGPIEQHHVAGRGLSPITVPLCRNCHAMITPILNAMTDVLREIALHDGLHWVPVVTGYALCLFQSIRMRGLDAVRDIIDAMRILFTPIRAATETAAR